MLIPCPHDWAQFFCSVCRRCERHMHSRAATTCVPWPRCTASAVVGWRRRSTLLAAGNPPNPQDPLPSQSLNVPKKCHSHVHSALLRSPHPPSPPQAPSTACKSADSAKHYKRPVVRGADCLGGVRRASLPGAGAPRGARAARRRRLRPPAARPPRGAPLLLPSRPGRGAGRAGPQEVAGAAGEALTPPWRPQRRA